MNILITGGASGLGEAITNRLASDKSSRIFFTYNSSKDKAGQLEKNFSNVSGIHCDFRETQSVDALVRQMDEMDLDCLVNNALTGLATVHFHKMDPEAFLVGFKNNVLPVIKITQKAILIFRKKKFGKIINVLTSYLEGTTPIGLSEYVAAKAYIESLSKSWGIENSKFNIVSNCISPTFMQTNLTVDTDERVLEEMASAQPLKRFLTVDEASAAVEALVKDNQARTGENIVLTAGRS